MTRLFSRICLFLCAAAAGATLLNGCTQTVETAPAPQQFASIRVINMAISDPSSSLGTVPMDVYMDPDGQTGDSLAKVNALAYGQASVYINNLPTGTSGTSYDIRVTPLRKRASTNIEVHKTLQPGKRYTLIVYTDTSNFGKGGYVFTSKFYEDGTGTPDNGHTYVRFINAQPGTGSLQLAVNDPNSSTLIPGSGGLTYAQDPGDYVALATAPDTSYTFYVTNANDASHSIVARLAFNSFAPGSYHTVIYGGDPTRVAPRAPNGNSADSMRIRVFDDNNLGNDQTFPIPLSFRYFIINNLITPSTPTPYVGFVVNNDPNPAFHDLTFPAVAPFGVAAANSTQTSDPSVLNVYPQGSVLTDAIDLKAFSIPDSSTSAGRSLVFDIHAGRKLMKSDNLYSILFLDTLRKLDSASSVTIPLPDQSSPDSVKLVLVSAIQPSPGFTARNSGLYGNFFVNDVAAPMNGSSNTGGKPGRYDNISLPFNGQSIKLSAKVGSKTNLVDVPDVNFTPVAGGIYEVVLTGQRTAAPRLYVYRVNP